MFMIKKLCAAALSLAVISGIIAPLTAVGAEDSQPISSENYSFSLTSYYDYLEKTAALPKLTEPIVLEGEAAVSIASGDAIISDPKCSQGKALHTKEGGIAAYSVSVTQEGLYAVRLSYLTKSSNGNDAVRSLSINGEIPFTAAGSLTFLRSYSDVLKNGALPSDAYGNQMTPDTMENNEIKSVFLSDNSGTVSSPFLFHFRQGANTISFEGVKEDLIIDKIELCQPEEKPTYQELTADYRDDLMKAAEDDSIYFEAEKTFKKSAASITPLYDRTSPATSPQNVDLICLNMIGGDRWKENGQWIQWAFDVEKAGYYRIVVRYRQDTLSGAFVSRKIYIDDEVPCKELENVRFDYKNGWNVQSIGDQNQSYYFYLDQGRHTMTMEVTLGQIGDILGRSKTCLNKLNEDYRKILAVTGPAPDTIRDYEFDELIPDVIADMKQQKAVLEQLAEEFERITGMRGEQTSVLNKITVQLGQMTENPRNIAKLFSPFKDNLAALGNWNFTMSTQPLELDYIMLAGKNVENPKAELGWLQNLWFHIKLIFASFFNDYNNVGNTEKTAENALEVWIPTGRDQAQILRVLANSDFVQKTNIPVNVKLVTAEALLPATLAKSGPDVAISNAENVPVNYAVRNAVLDLTEFEDYKKVLERFYPSAVVPFQYQDALYALPENQSFPMMFVRMDILQSLDLEVPETWDDLIHIMPVIKKQNLDIGVQTGYPGMLTFMYQQGGNVYNDALDSVTFDQNVAIDSFKLISDLCTLYRLPITYDFPNRFRSGEMPIGIVDYTVYNQLTVFAPEIEGLWKMVQLPGTLREDGSVDHTAVSTSTGAMILKNCQNKEHAWEFLKWWTEEDTQTTFGTEMESTLGSAAKQPTANRDALARLPWSKSDYQSLSSQLEKTKGVPVVPGDYIISREIGFAFTDVYNNGKNPVDALDDRIPVINEELARKRREFVKANR